MSYTPTLPEILRHTVEGFLSGVYTSAVARVETYDPTTRTVTATPACTRPVLQEDGSYKTLTLPTYSDVPVLFPSGGGFRIIFPLKKGDGVLLLYPSQHPGTYMSSGQVGVDPGFGALHDGSYCLAIPGVVPTQDVRAVDGGDTDLVIEVTDGCTIRLGAAAVVLGGKPADSDFVALAGKVDAAFAAVRSAIAAGVPVPQDGGAALQSTMLAAWSIPPVAATKTKAV